MDPPQAGWGQIVNFDRQNRLYINSNLSKIFFNRLHRVLRLEKRYITCLTRNFWKFPKKNVFLTDLAKIFEIFFRKNF